MLTSLIRNSDLYSSKKLRQILDYILMLCIQYMRHVYIIYFV